MGWWMTTWWQVSQNKAAKKCEHVKIRRSCCLPDVKDAGKPLTHKARAPPKFPECYFFLRKWLHAGTPFHTWAAEPEALQPQPKAALSLSSGESLLRRLQSKQRAHRRKGSHNAAITQRVWTGPLLAWSGLYANFQWASLETWRSKRTRVKKRWKREIIEQ